jgi:hypothetical protein
LSGTLDFGTTADTLDWGDYEDNTVKRKFIRQMSALTFSIRGYDGALESKPPLNYILFKFPQQ